MRPSRLSIASFEALHADRKPVDASRAAIVADSCAASTVPGLASIVISMSGGEAQPGSRRRPAARPIARPENRLGVPPPMKIEVISRVSGCCQLERRDRGSPRRCRRLRAASPRRPCELKSQYGHFCDAPGESAGTAPAESRTRRAGRPSSSGGVRPAAGSCASSAAIARARWLTGVLGRRPSSSAARQPQLPDRGTGGRSRSRCAPRGACRICPGQAPKASSGTGSSAWRSRASTDTKRAAALPVRRHGQVLSAAVALLAASSPCMPA